MLLYNADIDEAERNHVSEDLEEDDIFEACSPHQSFFDLRQRTLLGMEQLPAFRVVALGLLRKLRTNKQGSVLYGEVEDALGRYFRLMDADMQRFVSLHETFGDMSGQPILQVAPAARTLVKDGMHEIAIVLLACSEMQQKALDLKLGCQRSIAENEEDGCPIVSFQTFAGFIEEALAVSDQLRRKHEELQQLRLKAMERVVDAKVAAASSSGSDSGQGSPAYGSPSSGSPAGYAKGAGSAEAVAQGMSSTMFGKSA
jgi:hypothetical protein